MRGKKGGNVDRIESLWGTRKREQRRILKHE